jgi:PAS domain S-box-containing protein
VAFLSSNPVFTEPDVLALSERLKRALNAARMVSWDWDLKTGRILYSDNAPDVLGISPDLAGMGWSAVHRDDAATLQGIVEEAIASQRDYVAKVRFNRPDNGALRWVEIRGSIICESGTPARISGIMLDVTDREERKAAEEAFRLREQRFRRIVSQSVAVAETKPDGHFTVVNDQFCRMTGYTRKELVQLRRTDITHPEDLPAYLEKFTRCNENLRPFEMEKRYIRKDGSVIWVHNSVAPVTGEDGRVDSIVTISIDISAQKAAEHELRVHHTELEFQNEELRLAREQLEASRARYFDLYDHAPVGYLTLSADGMIVEANLAAASLLGVARSMLPGLRLSRFLLKGDEDTYYFLFRNLSKTGRSQTCEVRITKGDGAPFWARLDATVAPDADGVPACRVVISDITERKHAEESLRQSEENLRRLLDQVREMNLGLERRVEERTRALQEANRELEAFGYTVSHDLRAPLRTLQGFSQALLEDYMTTLPPKGRGYLERIGVAAARMDELIQDLLMYSRISRAELRLEPLELSSVVRGACRQLQGVIEESHANVDLAPLPRVCGHRATLVQMFANLLSNSLKFVAPGERPSIRISAEQRGDTVRVWVVDNGIGIEPEHRERIFKVFQRLHGLEKYPGTGIGLAIVRRGAERLGGAAGVESGRGRGSRFWVDLKAAGDQ